MATLPGASAGAPPPLPPPPPDPSVAVWEWQDEFGHWRPYRSAVCSYIEQAFQALAAKGRRSLGAAPLNGSIPLGQADAALAPYVIDVPSLTQFRQDTGTMRAVRRRLFPLDSAAGQGVVWEWRSDEGGWSPYAMAACICLEEAFAAGHPRADLGPVGYHYGVDFASGTQTNKATGYRRHVRRRVDSPYPVAAAAASTPAAGPLHAGPSCSCQQCLVNHGSGPITSRFRHSAASLPGPSAGTVPRSLPGGAQGPGRAASLGSSFVGFVPYNKPPGSGGARAAPRLSVQSHVASQGASVPQLPVSLARASRVSHALAGMAAFLMSVPGRPVRLTPAPPPGRAHRASKKPHHPAKEGKRAPAKAGASGPEDVVRRYLEEVKTPPADEDCLICMEKLGAPSGYSDASQSRAAPPAGVGRLAKCGHTFHLLCVLAMYSSGNKDGSLQCPACKAIYGEKTGTQPNGRMDVSRLPASLPGHEGCGSIQITYSINKGIQGPEHPNPGQPYTARGFPRYCYLPDNPKGRKVLELLRVAWQRRLIFAVGTSSTTGESNTVVWNEIHHKTEMHSNASGHGYPDPNYLDNVLAELAAQGVTEDCLGT